MIRSVRKAAGLGDLPAQYCTNDSEAINSAVKQHLKLRNPTGLVLMKK